MTTDPMTPAGRCPFHTAADQTGAGTASLTRQDKLAPAPGAATPDARGMYRVYDFQAARDLLRSDAVRQAGFMAEVATRAPGLGRAPVLFAEGEEHHEMRRSTARYFTPTHVERYQPMIAGLADDLIGRLARDGEANLDDLSLKLAVEVAAQVVGITDSAVPGLERRVMAFVEHGADSEPGAPQPRGRGGKLGALWRQRQILAFFLLDVKPSIAARRRERKDDLISHLLDRGYTDTEILTECLTYGTAGMVTTREFITVAAWHMLRRPELRAEYVHGTEKERHAILHEILRLEPVVKVLYRRALEDVQAGDTLIPQGSVVALSVQETNVDPTMVGEDAAQLCPGRPLPRGVQAPVLSFGDGSHRCPGAFLAIKESDLFLRRLLIWNDLHLVSPPDVGFNETVKGYELRGLRVGLGGTGPSGDAARA